MKAASELRPMDAIEKAIEMAKQAGISREAANASAYATLSLAWTAIAEYLMRHDVTLPDDGR